MSILQGAAAVLRLFSPERQELSVTDAARLLSVPKSSASRLLKAMLAEQLLLRSGDTQRYRVGHLVFEASRAYLASSTLFELVDGELGRICGETGHTGYISILDGSDVLVLRVHLGTQPLRVVTPLGSRARAVATATGRALLARLDRDTAEAIPPGEPRSANSPRTAADLAQALEQVRRRGWSEAVDEEIAGVGSVAVAVADPATGEALAFCLTFPAHTVPKSERQLYAARLVDCASRVAVQLDDRFWTERHRPRIAAA